MLIEQVAEFRFTTWRFAQQAAIADLFDIVCFQVNLDGEAVF